MTADTQVLLLMLAPAVHRRLSADLERGEQALPQCPCQPAGPQL